MRGSNDPPARSRADPVALALGGFTGAGEESLGRHYNCSRPRPRSQIEGPARAPSARIASATGLSPAEAVEGQPEQRLGLRAVSYGRGWAGERIWRLCSGV